MNSTYNTRIGSIEERLFGELQGTIPRLYRSIFAEWYIEGTGNSKAGWAMIKDNHVLARLDRQEGSTLFLEACEEYILSSGKYSIKIQVSIPSINDRGKKYCWLISHETEGLVFMSSAGPDELICASEAVLAVKEMNKKC